MSESSNFQTILPRPSSRGGERQGSQEHGPSIKRKRSFVALACVGTTLQLLEPLTSVDNVKHAGKERPRQVCAKGPCDGRRPICKPCEQRQVECIYDFPDDVPAARRGKREIARLSKANIDLKNVIETLRAGSESNALALIRKIRAARTVEHSLQSIADSAGLSSKHESGDQSMSDRDTGVGYRGTVSESTMVASPVAVGNPDGNISESHSTEAIYESANQRPTVDILPISKWTAVPGDDQHFSELFTLLWTWDTTFTRIIDRSTFEEDLRNGANELIRDSPERQFCSTFLVNSMLAFASVYNLDEDTFTQVGVPSSRGRDFVAEAEAQIPRKSAQPSFDLLQGLVMLFAYEARIGQATRSKEHLEHVFEVYGSLAFDREEVQREIDASNLEEHRVIEAKSKAAWGLYIFDWTLSHTYGTRKRLSKPTIAKIWQNEDASISNPDSPEYWWFQWPKSLFPQRSYYREVFDAECSLVEIAEDILIHLYPNQPDKQKISQTASMVSSQALSLYNRLRDWKIWFSNTIPDEGSELPQTLHVAYCYEMLVVVVLRKVTRLSKEQFGSSVDPQTLCYIHCASIMSILWTYRALYTVRYEYWAIQACSLVAFSTIFNLDLDTTQQDSFEKACKMLLEISQVYPVAADFLFGIRVTVEKYGVKVSTTARRSLAMVDRALQGELTENWRASMILSAQGGVPGGIADVSLGGLTEGFQGFTVADR